jgi:predicted nucleic acid-binding protein
MSGNPTERRVLADTSFMFAVMDRGGTEHEEALTLYDDFPDPILIPTITLPELAYLINRRGGSKLVVTVMRAIRQSQVTFTDLIDTDYDRALEILDTYSDSRIDFVDACIMALAERLNITRIVTFDRRDFGLYRPAHCDAFELLP